MRKHCSTRARAVHQGREGWPRQAAARDARHVLGAVLDRREERRLGLADGYGTTDTVARDVLKAPDLVDYTVKESLTNRVARKFGAAVGGAAMKALTAGGASVSLR